MISYLPGTTGQSLARQLFNPHYLAEWGMHDDGNVANAIRRILVAGIAQKCRCGSGREQE